MRCTAAAAVLVLFVIGCIAGDAAGTETAAASFGAVAGGASPHRKLVGCKHGHMPTQLLHGAMAAQRTAAQAESAAVTHTRQLLQAAPAPRRPAKPAPALAPGQRKGFATGRRPTPAGTQRKP